MDSLLKLKFKKFSKILNFGSMFLAALILFAWAFDVDSIKYMFPNSATMNPASCVCFIVFGIAFLLLFSDFRKFNSKSPAIILLLFSISVAILRLCDFMLNTDLGIDGILFPNELQSESPGVLSNRMSLNSACSFIILSISLILSQSSNRNAKRFGNYAVGLVLLAALVAIIGYFYQVKELNGYLTYTPMPPQSAIAFILAGMAILFMNSEAGFMATITSSLSGGAISRYLIPAAIVAPICIGYVRLVVQRKTPISIELGTAFLITIIVILFFLLILMVSFIINKKDIQRKSAEDELAQLNLILQEKVEQRTQVIISNEKRNQSLIENSLEGITLLDSQLNSFYQSPAVKSIMGYDMEERSRLRGDLIFPEDQPKATELFSGLLSKPNQRLPFLYRVFHKNGSIVWIEGTAINLLQDPDVKAVVTNFRDVTERKEAEKRIAASEQGLRAILESSADAYVISDENLVVKYQSASAERMTGISLAERQANPNKRYTHPDDVHELRKHVDELLKFPEKPVPFQLRFLHANGNYIWIEGVMANLLHDPNVRGLSFHYRDITDRKRLEEVTAANEQRFRTLIENISDAIVLNDAKSNILYQSPSVERILGYKADERKGRKVLDYVHPDYHDQFVRLYQNLERIPGRPFSFQYKFLHKNGYYIWLEGFVTNLLEDPNVMAYVANYRDISERKNAEEQILKLNSELEDRVDLRTKQLQAANKEMEAFTYSVSHDLRAPLRIINGFGQILKEDYGDRIDAEGQKILDRIMSNSKRMGRLIDDLLDFSRLGKTDMAMSTINMRSLVNEIIEELAASGIQIPSQITIDQLPDARGDFSLIKQVWGNLLSNAIKYSSKKEFPNVEVGVLEDQGKIIYFVKDNGDGFDMQYYSKLFGVFQRLHKESEFTGTGVGLALVQRIILRHGGRVWAEGEPGVGATFFFYLPS